MDGIPLVAPLQFPSATALLIPPSHTYPTLLARLDLRGPDEASLEEGVSGVSLDAVGVLASSSVSDGTELVGVLGILLLLSYFARNTVVTIVSIDKVQNA